MYRHSPCLLQSDYWPTGPSISSLGDVEVFRFFLHSGVWQDYAAQFLSAAQHDKVDINAIERLLVAAK